MEAILWVVYGVLIVCAVSLIVLVLMQKSSSGGLGSAFGGGGSDNYFGKNKNQSKEARLALLTKIDAGLIAALSITLVLLLRSNTPA